MRAPPADHWEPTLPAEDRERYSVAWQAYRCCSDCAHWCADDEEPDVGACDTEKYAAFLTPEDYTCERFEAQAAACVNS